MSAAGRESAAVEGAPSVRVVNRSEYWSCALLWSVSMFIFSGGGIGIFVYFSEVLNIDDSWAFLLAHLISAPAFLILHSPFPDTTDWVRLGDDVELKRINLKSVFPCDRITVVEFARPGGEDYDEKQHALQFAEVTFRFRRMWPAWLLVSHSDAEQVKTWAEAHGVPVVYRPGWASRDDDAPGQSRDC